MATEEEVFADAMAKLEPIRETDPVAWWDGYMQTLSWIDSQRAIPRNSKEGCLAKQQKFNERQHRASS